MLVTLFCFFIISVKLKNLNITLTSNIKFTSEIEMSNSLSFLDVKIVRENNKFTISVYLKSASVVCLLILRVLYVIRTNT